ncbi:MAG: Fe-S cluster assembly protein SufD [Planctomycetota bacterium]
MADTQTGRTTKPAEHAHLVELAERFDEQVPAVAPWIAALRERGRNRFQQVGFPGRVEEAWRHSHAKLRSIRTARFDLPTTQDATSLRGEYSLVKDAAAELVFVNGQFDADLSRTADLPGVTIGRLTDAPEEAETVLGTLADITANPFVALSNAFLHDGAFLKFARGTTLDTPIHLLFIQTADTPTVVNPRVLVIAEDEVEATFVESYVGTGSYFTNAVVEVLAGDRCKLDHVKLNQESPEAAHIATMEVTLGEESNFADHAGILGAGFTRNDLNCTLAGEQVHATLNGVVIGTDARHIDNHTLLRHNEPNCTSYELYKHVMDDTSTGVFKGKIYVDQKAQKTDAVQNSRSLLLSDDAQMNSQPALEIYADDVKCTHGSTTGPLDEGAMFYLNSRGVDPDTSRRLLTYAFAADVTRRIKVEAVRARIEDFMAKQHGLPTDFRIQELAEDTDEVVY